MAKKPRKQTSHKDHIKKSKGNSLALFDQNSNWLVRVLFALLGAVLTFILLSRLQFGVDIVAGTRLGLPILVLLIVIWGTTPHFVKNKSWISWGILGLILLQLAANLTLQFDWLISTAFLRNLATIFILPTAALWACLLAQSNTIDNINQESSSFLSTFSKPAILIPSILVFVIGCVLIFYRLGHYDFYEDEGMVINAAVGLRDQGFSYLAEGYDRAWIHSWLVSHSIQIFGESEWSARLPSAVFGLVFILTSFYVFCKWFKWPWLGILVPLICLLTDEFLILFRYTRMYAVLIPIFLLGIYLSYVFLTKEVKRSFLPGMIGEGLKFHPGYGLAALFMMGLAFHIHVLSAVGFLGAFFLLVVLWISTRQKRYMVFLFIALGIGIMSYALGLAEVDFFRMIPKAMKRMMMTHTPELAYYKFLGNNGLPTNITLMAMVGGIGLFFNRQWSLVKRQILGFLYMVIVSDFIFMVYLLADEGRDYRYIVHIVPLVVAIEFIVLFATGKLFSRKIVLAALLSLPLLYTGYTMSKEYKEVYIRHPWSPSYSEVYPDIKLKYKVGEALFYQNIKTYYLDPKELAGEHAIKMGRKQEYSLDQFKQAIKKYSSGWVVFDYHKSYHIDPSIIQYLQINAQKLHGNGIDETGVEVYYFVQQ